MARAALSVITSALNPLSTMQTCGPESLICMVTKICFLKYSKGSVTTGALSPVRNASRALESAALPPPNDKSAIAPRIAGHRIRSLKSIFRSNSFAVHRPARQPESCSRGWHAGKTFRLVWFGGQNQEGSTSGLTWEPDKGNATAVQAVRSAASDQPASRLRRRKPLHDPLALLRALSPRRRTPHGYELHPPGPGPGM